MNSKLSILIFSIILHTNTIRAAELSASDGAATDRFGNSVSISDTIGLVGAWFDSVGSNSNQGSAYLFQNLGTASGAITQNVKLTASDGMPYDLFGQSVSVSGSAGLVGSTTDNNSNTNQGSAYLFRNLDTASETITQSVKLMASDGSVGDQFGNSVSLSSSYGLVGAWFDGDGDNYHQGSAYLFRNLDTAAGTITQNIKLTASDGKRNADFGRSVSLSGSYGLVGASGDTIGSNTTQGSAYLFRNLDTETGTITQNVKLIASDGQGGDLFGASVSLSGSAGLVGAAYDNIGAPYQGSAYLFRNLDIATGTITQNVKLIPSDGVTSSYFGASVSLSGNIGLIGAYGDKVGDNFEQGSAYIFRELDFATGTITQNIKLTASNGAAHDLFGQSVSLDGDNFLVGASGVISSQGKAYVGSVSSITTLDIGNASRSIDHISFVSQDDWIIGQATDANQITLAAGNTGTVTADGNAVYIGKDTGSDQNVLILAGTLIATNIYVGNLAGNTGNTLRLDSTATFTINTLFLAPGNTLSLQGDTADYATLFTRLGASMLEAWNGATWITLNTTNAASYLTASSVNGYTTFVAVPEPSAWGLLIGGLGLAFLMHRLRT